MRATKPKAIAESTVPTTLMFASLVKIGIDGFAVAVEVAVEVATADEDEAVVVTSAPYISRLSVSTCSTRGEILATCDDGKVGPVDVETEVSNIVDGTGIKTDVRIVVRCFHGGPRSSQIAELAGHITGTTSIRD